MLYFFEDKLQPCFNESFNIVKLSRNRAKDKKWFTSIVSGSVVRKNWIYIKLVNELVLLMMK